METGALLASAAFATLVVSVPIGLLADRAGARAVTIASAGLFVLSALGQGLAGDFWSLLAARTAFGISFGTVFTAGLAWLAEVAPAYASSSALGATATISGVAFTGGPALAGLLADHFGVGVPFLAVAAAAAVVAVSLLRGDSGRRTEESRLGPPGTVRAARRDELLLGSLVLMLLIGFTGGGINLLVPLQLRAHGVSAGAIGLALSGAAGLYTLVSALVARLGARAATLKAGGLGALLSGCSILLLVASGSTAAAIGFLLLRAPFWALTSTIVYPLGAAGAERARLGRGAVLGLVNLAWGIAATVGPLVAGAIAEATGQRWAYGLIISVSVATAAWMLSADRALSAATSTETP